ncbi:hypothetical protein [Actinomadura formosensis]|uniref:hypothetical protein n=1 Tax=Actinomadura formosensis TaxID=60706 RepID=UPI003D949AF6
MAKIVDYGAFEERLRRVMPDAGERDPAVPADTGPRWELLRQFQREWGYEVPEGVEPWPRWSEDRHKAYVRRLEQEWTGEEDDEFGGVDFSLPVPDAIDQWWDLPFNSFTYSAKLYYTNPEYPPTVRPDPSGYGIAGAIQRNSDLVPPDADRRVCVFMAEYEYCNEWGYPAADAHLPDPRVLVSVSDDTWVLQARSITEFFLLLAVHRLPPSLGWTVETDVTDEQERLLRAELTPMGFEPWRELEHHTVVLGGPDVIAYFDRDHDWDLTVAGRTREAVDALGDRLGLDWSDEISAPHCSNEE